MVVQLQYCGFVNLSLDAQTQCQRDQENIHPTRDDHERK